MDISCSKIISLNLNSAAFKQFHYKVFHQGKFVPALTASDMRWKLLSRHERVRIVHKFSASSY